MINKDNFKQARLSSKFFKIYKNQLRIIFEGESVFYKYSSILEPWVEIYDLQENHMGTIPEKLFKREFLFYQAPN